GTMRACERPPEARELRANGETNGETGSSQTAQVARWSWAATSSDSVEFRRIPSDYVRTASNLVRGRSGPRREGSQNSRHRSDPWDGRVLIGRGWRSAPAFQGMVRSAHPRPAAADETARHCPPEARVPPSAAGDDPRTAESGYAGPAVVGCRTPSAG